MCRAPCSITATTPWKRPTHNSTSWAGSCGASGTPATASPRPEHAAAALEVALGFDQLEEMDVVVRDLESGLIDFPSLLGGQEVYLCWLLGEPSVGHWHAVEGGFAGRRLLD